MLSTITIVSIFTEIFTAGILLSGAATFLRRGKSLPFGLLLLAFFAYVAFTIASQLMFNMGRGLAELILVQKCVVFSLVICSFCLWLFIVEKFAWRKLHLLSLALFLLSGFFAYLIWLSPVNLIYREEVVEPILEFSARLPVRLLFAILWLVLGVFAVGAAAAASAAGRRTLLFFSGGAAFLLALAQLSAFYYVRSGEPGYLLASWLISLVAFIGLLLGEVVPADSPAARSPLSFLRTRLLFKLMLIFVLLIVILFEATTLATINISKRALSQSIRDNYLIIAEAVIEDIDSQAKAPGQESLQAVIAKAHLSRQAVIFIVDQQGKLTAHPDKKRALQSESLTGNEAVRRLLKGSRGAAEFRDELGAAMVGAYLPSAKHPLGVIVQEPMAAAYFEIRRLETNSLLFVIAGIVLTALAGIFFASSIEKPIRELTLGTEAVAQGKLGYHITSSSIDEIGKLAEAFNQMTRDLRDSQERLILSEKLASLGTMAAGMAHEIKNPLVSLRTFTQLLQQKWEDKEFRDKFSAIIPQEIERINRIAESLLKFGRPMKPELTRVDVNSLLEEVLLLFESECKKNNVRVTKKLAELPEIAGDAGQLSQAFVNIVKNGIESMTEKGGELIVKTDVGEVVKLGKMQRQGVKHGEEMIWGEEGELGRPVPVVFVEISDTGEGISDENLKSLFDPFFTTKMTGTGMGLPITLRIIEEHKGSIKVRSKPGKGTTFIITLPRQV